MINRGHLGGFLFFQGQIGDGAVYGLFQLFLEAGNGQILLHRAAMVGAVFRNEAQSHPAEDVVNDAGCVADLRIAGKAPRFKALVREFLHQVFQRHSVLQRNTGQGRDAVHQAADGGAFLGHGDEKLARLAVFVQTHSQVTLVTGDLELVIDGGASRGQTVTYRFVGAFFQRLDHGFHFRDAFAQDVVFFRGKRSVLFGILAGIERL